jgi:dTDP-4-amino-4,6-dideoxygalactose transaminase
MKPHVGTGTIPVCRPLLPSARHVVPYLECIDANRWYTNFGPLVSELEIRMAGMLECSEGEVASAGSGTLALCGALLATAGWATSERPYCLMPSYTFVGTAAAARACGYTPYFVDIDPDTWALDASALVGHSALRRAGAVVPVMPFGRPFANKQWATFTRETGIPVVIDGAAALDAIASNASETLGDVPVAISLHATKTLSTGEGGCVIWRNADGIIDVVRYLNFGIFEARRSDVCGINGKLSEYAAAVGLADLDDWPRKRKAYQQAAETYAGEAAINNLERSIIAETSWASPYCLLKANSELEADRVRDGLARAGIGTRFWYGFGCHRQPAYQDMPRDLLPFTDLLAARILGLPFFPDISKDEISAVVSMIRDILT